MKWYLIYFFLALIIACTSEPIIIKKCPKGYYGNDCQSCYNELCQGKATITDACVSSGNDSYGVNLYKDTSSPYKFYITGLWEENNAVTKCEINNLDKTKFNAMKQPIHNSGFDIELIDGTIDSLNKELSFKYYIIKANIKLDSCRSIIKIK